MNIRHKKGGYRSLGMVTIVIGCMRWSIQLSHQYQLQNEYFSIQHSSIGIDYKNKKSSTGYLHTLDITYHDTQISLEGVTSEKRYDNLLLYDANITSTGGVHRLDVWYATVIVPSLNTTLSLDTILENGTGNQYTLLYTTTHSHTMSIGSNTVYLTRKESCPRYQTLRKSATVSCILKGNLQLLLPIQSSTHIATISGNKLYQLIPGP